MKSLNEVSVKGEMPATGETINEEKVIEESEKSEPVVLECEHVVTPECVPKPDLDNPEVWSPKSDFELSEPTYESKKSEISGKVAT